MMNVHGIILAVKRLPWLICLLLAAAIPADRPAVSGGGPSGGTGLPPDHACRFWGLITPVAQDALIQDHLLTGTYRFARLGDANPDGWGIAFFTPYLQVPDPGDPLVLRARTKSSDTHDQRFAEAVGRMMELDAERAIAHVRRASTGAIRIPDPHPLTRGGVVFAHNGTIDTTTLVTLLEEGDPDYLTDHPPDYLDRYLDSELYFLYILRLRDEGVETGGPVLSHALADAIAEAARRAHQEDAIQTAANCIAILGDTLFALRFDPSDGATYKLRYHARGDGWEVASEPVGTDTSGWSPIPAKSVGIFRCGEAPLFLSAFPPDMPYLDMGSLSIDDDASGGSDGNGDGGADSGEELELTISVRNDGGEKALGVEALLASEDALVEITDPVEQYGDIAAGAQAGCLEDFDVRISPACPPGHEIAFSLTLTCTGRPSWVRYFSLPVEAPLLEVGGWSVADAPPGDGDGRIDPGETVALTVRLANHGSEDATNLAFALGLTHPHASILAGNASLALLAPGAELEAQPPFSLAVDGACPDPDLLFFDLGVAGDYGYGASLEFEVPAGGFWDDVEAGPGAWTHYPVTADWADQWHRSSRRNWTPEGDWSWKFGDTGGGSYANHADGALEMAAQTLRPVSFLRFRHWMQAELRPGGQVYCYDGGMVEMSLDGGTWEQIFPVGGYPCRITTAVGTGPWPNGTHVYSGNIAWQEALFEIRDEQGSARFRFRFGSNTGITAEGWYIDDIEFYGFDPGETAVSGDPVRESAAGLAYANPNPFRREAAIAYYLPQAGETSLTLFDAGGRQVRSLHAGLQEAGLHRVIWDGRDDRGSACAAGVYLCRLSSPGTVETRKILRLH